MTATSTMSQSSLAMPPLPGTNIPGNGAMEENIGAGSSGGLTCGVECIIGIVVGISLMIVFVVTIVIIVVCVYNKH